jgi:hypothetical protein
LDGRLVDSEQPGRETEAKHRLTKIGLPCRRASKAESRFKRQSATQNKKGAGGDYRLLCGLCTWSVRPRDVRRDTGEKRRGQARGIVYTKA